MARSIPTFHLKAAAHEQSCAQETHLPTETTTQASSHATPTNPSPTAKISAALAIQLSSPAIAVAIPAFEAENPPLSSKLAQIKALMRDQRKKPAADSTTTGSSSSTPSPVLEGTKTPSTSTSSEPPRAPSPPKGKVCAKWTDDKWSGVAKEAHYKRAQVFGRTRQMMRNKSRNMIVMASRGYGRSGHVPTKFTKPRLHKRRYSVDVLTLNRDGIIDGPPAKGTNIEVLRTPAKCDEAEPILQKTPDLLLPNPRRYPAFCVPSAHNPINDNSLYLELGTAVLHNEPFNHITDYEWPHAWMRDEALNMALEVLRRDMNCDRYSIGFADSNMTQTFQIALSCNETSAHHYDCYREQFGDKRWIFITVNDATGSLDEGGTHWSLAVLDRVHKRGHYIDSYFIRKEEAQELGKRVSCGLLQILGENLEEWQYYIEYRSPHQNFYNRTPWDKGSCGPFVYRMTQTLVHNIKQGQDAGREQDLDLRFFHGYQDWWGHAFNSIEVRYEILNRIARWKVFEDSMMLMYQHDQRVREEEDVMLLDTPDITSFGQPPAPALAEASGLGTDVAQLEEKAETHDDDANYTIIGESDDELLSNDSSFATEPPEDILLDDLNDVVLNDESSPPQHRRHEPRPRQSSEELAKRSQWGVEDLINNNDGVEATTPIVRRAQTPFRTGSRHQHEM